MPGVGQGIAQRQAAHGDVGEQNADSRHERARRPSEGEYRRDRRSNDEAGVALSGQRNPEGAGPGRQRHHQQCDFPRKRPDELPEAESDRNSEDGKGEHEPANHLVGEPLRTLAGSRRRAVEDRGFRCGDGAHEISVRAGRTLYCPHKRVTKSARPALWGLRGARVPAILRRMAQ